MTGAVETFQIPLEAAEAYESRFVPVMFGPWAKRLVRAAGVARGSRVLDVACGTGAVAREAADRIASEGHVVGLDSNEAMLVVARRVRPDIEWRRGDASELPFSDNSFDAVLCQAALMFFPDPQRALWEMARVVSAGGTVAVQVWDRREAQDAYGPFIEVVERHAGAEAVGLLYAYFSRGDLDELTNLLDAAGLAVSSIETATTTVPFASVSELVAIEIQSTPLGDRLHEDVIARVIDEADEALASYVSERGLDMPIGGHVIVTRPR